MRLPSKILMRFTRIRSTRLLPKQTILYRTGLGCITELWDDLWSNPVKSLALKCRLFRMRFEHFRFEFANDGPLGLATFPIDGSRIPIQARVHHQSSRSGKFRREIIDNLTFAAVKTRNDSKTLPARLNERIVQRAYM